MVKRKQEKEEKVDDSNYQHTDAVNNKETHEVEEVERRWKQGCIKREKKKYVSADISKQHWLAQLQLARMCVCVCYLTGVEGLPCLGAGAVGLDHFEYLSVLLQSCCTWKTSTGETTHSFRK